MGYAHLLWIYEDGIRHVEQYPEDAPKYREAIGAAVLKLCLEPAMMQTPQGIQPVTHEPIFNQGNCVNHAATLHSTDEQVFIWARNRPRTLDQLNDDEIDGAKRLFDALYERRKNRSA
jgi:hypothetical protein